MSTIEHPAPPKAVVVDDWYRGTDVDRSGVPPQPTTTDEAWREMPADPRGAPTSSGEAAFGAGRLILLTLVALVILAPFAPGLILVGLAAAILAVPYLLVRSVLGRD
jgi:hypothetical protein